MQPPLRTILFASPVSDFRGGAERSMYELVLNTRKHGYRAVIILPRQGEISKALDKAGIDRYIVNYDWWVRSTSDKSPTYNDHRQVNGEAVIKITEIIKNEKPSICMTYTAVFPWLAYASAMTNTPHAWQLCEMLNDGMQWQLRIPLQTTMSIIDTMSTKVFANSESCKLAATPLLPSHANKVDIIYPYVDHEYIKKQSVVSYPKDLDEKKFIISVVGNIQESKRQIEAIQAILEMKSKKKNILLLLIGGLIDDNYVERIQQLITDNKLTNVVKLVGYSSNPHVYVANSDLAIITSPHESFGRVSIEAMSLGVPVIGAACDGTLEIIGHTEENGLLYEPGNTKSLAKQIDIMINNPTKRRGIAKSGQYYVQHKFTLENTHSSFFKFIENNDLRNRQYTMPLSDIAIAYRVSLSQLASELRAEKQISRQLNLQLENILHSKKWKIVNKVSKLVNFFS